MRANLFYYPFFRNCTLRWKWIFHFLYAIFFTNYIFSFPVQDLDNPKAYRYVKINKSIYQSAIPIDEIVQLVKVQESKSHIYLLVPISIFQVWKNRKLPLSYLPYPKKFSDIDPHHTIRYKEGCVPLRDMINGYKTNFLNELYLTCIAAEFPNSVQKISIGKSAKNHNIAGLKISIPNHPIREIQASSLDQDHKKSIRSNTQKLNRNISKEYRDTIFIHCSIHSNEILATEHCYDTIQSILLDKSQHSILQNLEVWIVPILNPDGSDDYWFVNTNLGRKNGQGVDLNRNFPFQWNSGYKNASSANPNSAYYRGEKAGSETEIKALVELFHKKKFMFSLSFHCYANSLLIPYSIENLRNPIPNLVAEIGDRLTKNIVSYRKDKEFIAKKNLYAVDGTDQDIFFHDFGTYAYLVESSHRVENYRNVPVILEGFRPIWQNLLKEYEKSWKVHLQILDESGKPIRAQITNNTYTYFEKEIQETNTDGIYHLLLPSSQRVRLKIHAEGYLEKVIDLKPVREMQYPEIILLKYNEG